MIVVKVELWPGGDPDKAESLGVMCIANRGQVPGQEPDLCTYAVELQRPDHRPIRQGLWHLRRHGWVRLVEHAFNKVHGYGERGVE